MGKRSKNKKAQKQRRIYESQVLPALERLEQQAKNVSPKLRHVIDPRADQALGKVKNKAIRLQARLQDPKMKQVVGQAAKVDTVASRPPNGYYVIVGRGAAATINHTTLRQSDKGRQRLGALPVMHIGFEDPWLNYHAHGMGQPPYLLRMPGYHVPVALDAATIRSGLNSRVFAASTHAEMELLKKKFEVYVVTAWVPYVQKQGVALPVKLKDELIALGLEKVKVDTVLDQPYPQAYPPYRVLMISPDASLHFVYAKKVDICNGAGQMNLANRDGVVQDAFKEAQSAPWIPPNKRDKSRKAVHGMDGLTETTPWDATLRYCICGSGGIALNQVERAHDVGNYLDWYATQFLHATTFGLERNDTVLKAMPNTKSNTNYMKEGEASAIRGGPKPADFVTAFPLIPGSPKWRIGQQCGNPTVTAGNALLNVTFAKPNEDPFLFDVHANADKDKQKLVNQVFPFSAQYQHVLPKPAWMDRSAAEYDRIILCMGQKPDGIGEPKNMTQGITLNPIVQQPGDRLVGLRSDDDAVRVLGAAAAAWPGITTGIAKGITMEEFRTTLPMSAVLPGFILAGVNIATANGFFDAIPNDNVNSTTIYELTVLLKGKPKLIEQDATRVADKIVTLRRWPHNGLADKAALTEVLKEEPQIDAILDVLSTDYRPADPWD